MGDGQLGLLVAMPVMDGVTAAKALPSVAPGTRVVILTLHDDSLTQSRAIEVGASDLVGKNRPPEDLIAAIRRAAHQARSDT